MSKESILINAIIAIVAAIVGGLFIWALNQYGEFKTVGANVSTLLTRVETIQQDLNGANGQAGLKSQISTLNSNVSSNLADTKDGLKLLQEIDKEIYLLQDQRAKKRIERMTAELKNRLEATEKLQEHVADLQSLNVSLSSNVRSLEENNETLRQTNETLQFERDSRFKDLSQLAVLFDQIEERGHALAPEKGKRPDKELSAKQELWRSIEPELDQIKQLLRDAGIEL